MTRAEDSKHNFKFRWPNHWKCEMEKYKQLTYEIAYIFPLNNAAVLLCT